MSSWIEIVQRASAGIARIQELLAVRSRIGELGDWEIGRLGEAGSGHDWVPKGALAVVFEGVSFGYDDSVATEEGQVGTDEIAERQEDEQADAAQSLEEKQIVLHDLSFVLNPGTVLGLLGRLRSENNRFHCV